MIAEWGSIEEALAGAPIFCAIPNVTRGFSLGAKLLEGTVATEGFRSALVHGSQTIWERDMIKVSFLWRTTRDVDFAQGFSGGVICLGKPPEKNCKPLLFQNFAHTVRKWPKGEPRQIKTVKRFRKSVIETIKGGFLLPDEIRNSRIILTGLPISLRPFSEQPACHNDTVGHRKDLTAPF